MRSSNGNQAIAFTPPPAPLPISQIAIVARDMDDALERPRRLGLGPLERLRAQTSSAPSHLHGQPTDYTTMGAENPWGSKSLSSLSLVVMRRLDIR